MRILIITNLYPSPIHPNRATFNGQQFKAIAEDHSVQVISPISWTDELSARGRGSVLPACRVIERDGMLVEYPRYLFPPRVLRSCYGNFYRWSIRGAFDRAIERSRLDVVLASWAYPDGWAAMKLARAAGLPVVIKVHGSDILLLACGGRRQRTIEALRNCDGVIAVSNDLAEKVVSFGVRGSRVRVIYNGVDTGVFSPGCSSDARARLGLDLRKPIILFIGNLAAVKGLDTLIDSCSRLRGEGSNFHCYLIGEGPLESTLTRQISDLGLQENVKLLGAKPHKELPDWFRAANVFVLPSRSEGVPNVLLEASACGTPFVASRVGGIPEIAHLGDGRLVPPGDAGALARAIKEQIASRESQPATREAAFRSHGDSAREIVGFLEEVTDQSSRARTRAVTCAASVAG